MFEDLENLRKYYLETNNKKFKTLEKRESEYRIAKEQIDRKYAKTIEENNITLKDAQEQLYIFDGKVDEYSSFNALEFGDILADLVTIMEGEKYIYQEAVHHTRILKPNRLTREKGLIDASFNIRMITKDKVKTQVYYSSRDYVDSPIQELLENGSAILLEDTEKPRETMIKFYKSQSGKVKSLANYGKFDYVKEYIDGVINYKYQNNNWDITQEELLLLLSEFIKAYPDLIMDNLDKRIKGRIRS